MKLLLSRLVEVVLLGALLLQDEQASACSTFLVGKDASADGSVMVTHSDDGEGAADPRIAWVPAAKFAAGATRPVYPDTEDFPRYVGKSRGPVYYPQPGQTETVAIGSIPQVASTYAYFEGNYGIQNEHQLSIGESTCSAKFVKAPLPQGKALFSVNALSRIAMERTTKARDAVKLMGDLAVQHGFYGPCADPDTCFEGSGETLLVGDPDEGWIFHILPDDTGDSAIWVARRVPDDEVTVVMNMFTIRHVNLTDSANYMGSENMFDIATRHGWWDGKGLLDFTQAFSDGEYNHQYYSGRRVWGAFLQLNPDVTLNPSYVSLRDDSPPPFPWSMKPKQLVSATDLMQFHKFHYEGTPFDQTKGIAAGPWGTPDRYATMGTPVEKKVAGSWERTIGLYRTTYTWIIQARSWLPDSVGGVFWIGPADGDKTCFVPFMSGSSTSLPTAYSTGSPLTIDRTSAFWAHRYVQNLVQLKYSMMIKDVRTQQDKWQSAGVDLVAELTTKYQDGTAASKAAVTAALAAHTAKVQETWWGLTQSLMGTFADGWLTTGVGSAATSVAVGYPEVWLDDVEYTKGPRLCNHTATHDDC